MRQGARLLQYPDELAGLYLKKLGIQKGRLRNESYTRRGKPHGAGGYSEGRRTQHQNKRRCLRRGQAIRRAVGDWTADQRIGILASGGLSHFTIDEELDRRLLDACRDKDAEALISIPLNKLNSGNSEIRNWITVAGAAERLDTEWQEYVPCYRSPAGTGCAMAFAVWS